MKDILLAIKEALEASGWFKSVFLSEKLSEEGDIIPRSFRLPAAGIKDAHEEAPQDGTAESLDLTHHAWVVIYAPLQTRMEAGEALQDLLDLTAQVRGLLHRNLLNIDGVVSAYYRGSEESDLIEFRSGVAVRKLLLFRYELEE